MYARLRGVPEDRIADVVTLSIQKLLLSDYTHKLAGNLRLSKRCVCILLFSNGSTTYMHKVVTSFSYAYTKYFKHGNPYQINYALENVPTYM